MELAGRAREIREIEDGLLVIFQTCIGDLYELYLSPAQKRLPIDGIARVWTERIYEAPMSPHYREVIQKWEDLSR